MNVKPVMYWKLESEDSRSMRQLIRRTKDRVCMQPAQGSDVRMAYIL